MLNDNTVAVCVTVVTIGAVLIVALMKDVNGTILVSGVGAICTILGWLLKGKVDAQKKPSTEKTSS